MFVHSAWQEFHTPSVPLQKHEVQISLRQLFRFYCSLAKPDFCNLHWAVFPIFCFLSLLLSLLGLMMFFLSPSQHCHFLVLPVELWNLCHCLCAPYTTPSLLFLIAQDKSPRKIYWVNSKPPCASPCFWNWTPSFSFGQEFFSENTKAAQYVNCKLKKPYVAVVFWKR